MNLNLWNLCQREALLTLRDQARKEARTGNPQAAHVVVWLDRILTTKERACDASNDLTPITSVSTAPVPRRFRPRAPRPMRMQ